MERLRNLLFGLLFLSVGFLAGSFWLEWRHGRVGPEGEGARVGAAPVLPEGWQSRVRVEVLNGVGEPGVARHAARRLRDLGFDVVYFGNAERFDHERTLVLDRSRHEGGARRLADALGVAEVTDRPAPELYVDATLILGTDWRRRLEGEPAADQEREEPDEPAGLFEKLLGGSVP